jgi:hypothetical protein
MRAASISLVEFQKELIFFVVRIRMALRQRGELLLGLDPGRSVA